MSKKIKNEIEAQLKSGLLEPSDSEWASPLHVVDKSDGSIRLVGDYRLLDKQIKPDKYNLPHIQDFTNRIQNAKFFSTIDMRSAFNQIPCMPSISIRPVLLHLGVFMHSQLCHLALRHQLRNGNV